MAKFAQSVDRKHVLRTVKFVEQTLGDEEAGKILRACANLLFAPDNKRVDMTNALHDALFDVLPEPSGPSTPTEPETTEPDK